MLRYFTHLVETSFATIGFFMVLSCIVTVSQALILEHFFALGAVETEVGGQVERQLGLRSCEFPKLAQWP